jgi:hypothetical protein
MAGHSLVVRKASAPKRKGKPKLSHLEVRHAENGGHIVRHHFEHGPLFDYHEPTEHVFGKRDGEKMLAHVGKHMGVRESTTGSKEEPVGIEE